MCGRAGDECGRKGLEEGGQRELVNIPSLQTHPCPLWLWSGGSEATYHPTAEEAKVHEMTPFNLKLEESQEPELFPSCKSTVPQEVSSSLTYPSLPPSSLVHASFYQRARLNLCFSVLSQQPCLVQESYRPLFFFLSLFSQKQNSRFPQRKPNKQLNRENGTRSGGPRTPAWVCSFPARSRPCTRVSHRLSVQAQRHSPYEKVSGSPSLVLVSGSHFLYRSPTPLQRSWAGDCLDT